ncbi:hypothetical protein [Enterococcus pallens]|uniref:hypothetical protein n=1 Tax=Enterococcus pallens TaxID=160454 RepID=UPI00039C182D|nr:hypothetical protein [Enterococcus pallens]OJG78577.1 hypothetical protein RV10_GL001359 [Enterococcus pallens]
MTKKDDKDKDVTPPMKKLVNNIILFVLACWLLRIGIAMLAEIWLPLLFLAIFVVCLTIGWRIRKAKKDWW